MTRHSRPLGIDLEYLRTPIDPDETDPANIAIDVAEKMLAQAIDTAQHALGFPGDSNEVLTLAKVEVESASRIYQTNQLVAAFRALAPAKTMATLHSIKSRVEEVEKMTLPIEKVLAQATEVKERQPGQWSARCPVHAESSPNLSIRQCSNGAVLLHCIAGCSLGTILSALDLQAGDLSPPGNLDGQAPPLQPCLLSAPQALELLADQARIVANAARNLANGVVFEAKERTQLCEIAKGIAWLADEALPLDGRRR